MADREDVAGVGGRRLRHEIHHACAQRRHKDHARHEYRDRRRRDRDPRAASQDPRAGKAGGNAGQGEHDRALTKIPQRDKCAGDAGAAHRPNPP